MQNVPEEPKRLSKVVAALLPCSRREAEQYIAEGWVQVDGKVVQEPQFRAAASASVAIDPGANLQPALPATFLVHKPAGMGTAEAQALLGAATHWPGDASGIRRVRSHAVGLVPLLALPAQAEGLSVFSQDGRIVRKPREDALVIEQELLAEVAGTRSRAACRGGEGLVREGRALPRARAAGRAQARCALPSRTSRRRWCPGTVRSGGPGTSGAQTHSHRPRADGGLPPGQWRYLAPGERF